MTKTKSVCVTGHRNIPPDKIEYVKKELHREITQAISDGYINFVSGFADGADLYYTAIVAELKKQRPDIQLEAAIPYRKRLHRLFENLQTREYLFACNWISVHGETGHKGVYAKRNQFMVDKCQRLIAVYDGRPTGGTAQTIRMAEKLNREVKYIRI